MVGNVEDEKLDPSRCEDEGVAKERMKRRADEGQEEDVVGNRSRTKTPRREIVSSASELEVASCTTLPEVERSKDGEIVAKKENVCDNEFARDAPRTSRPLHLNSSGSEVEPPSQSDEEALGPGVLGGSCEGVLEPGNDIAPAEVGGSRSDAVGPEEQQVVFVAPLLNRFPSIDGDEEDGEEQLQGGNAPRVAHEEAAEIVDDEDEEVGVGERWSRASSEPDQVWYSERTSDTLVAGWLPPPRQLYCKRPEENED